MEKAVDRVILISRSRKAGVVVGSRGVVKVLEIMRVLHRAGAQRQKYCDEGDGRDAAHGRGCCLISPEVSTRVSRPMRFVPSLTAGGRIGSGE